MKFAKTLTIVAAATLIGSGAFSTAANVSADDVSDAKSAVTKNQTSTNALLAKLQTAQDNVMKINNQISDKTVEIDTAKANITTTQAKIDSYQAQIVKAEVEVKSRKSVLKKQLVSLQKEVGESATGNVYFDFLLNAKSFSDLVSRSFTINKLNEASQNALDAVKEAEAKQVSLKSAQETKKTELVATKTKLDNDMTQLTSLKDQATKDADSLTKQINDNKAQLTTLQSNVNKATAAAAAALVAQTQTTTAAATPVKTSAKASSNSSTGMQSTVSYGDGSKSAFVQKALSFVGTPYVWGGASASGLDCSGLVMLAARLSGLGSLPHNAAAQSSLGHSVSLSSLQPGDLLFWGSPAYHVAIYIGGGQYVHAPKPGDVVHTASLSGWSPAYARRL
ncbi:MAG: NlpC/P60 family protein [Lactobacillus sp.]|jgi:cell wall-associated NlpC family hydrolase|uniref:NlpC/P60 family protein n=1 Tax=Lacticaseibacillus suilingensis TaxID=2799577 RepID=A0ABW4BBD0_9LACO|nr:C40 family peptidase [Lacticaseibacillus suilingensis]MCI1893230.1 NlpC/P60 family protein [Lactobacillus sp.]MCI1917390.1 NlpC/P60 family protein [Lactobacillus sp.]MCI1940820.1 NlpC/P60 family protein [Lactobacillus sp.]MCI1971199.1 NlpC/P60 family protein [Lactobacillus sp.]MCI2036990.1 NlpC/P60 family protein [Lactobacillus sp.]